VEHQPGALFDDRKPLGLDDHARIARLQTAICTETGELLFFGLGVQYFAGWMDYVIAYVMEHHGEDIADGDMWMCNDPWIGTATSPT